MEGWIVRRANGDEFEVLVKGNEGTSRPYYVLRSLTTGEDISVSEAEIETPALWTRVRLKDRP